MKRGRLAFGAVCGPFLSDFCMLLFLCSPFVGLSGFGKYFISKLKMENKSVLLSFPAESWVIIFMYWCQ